LKHYCKLYQEIEKEKENRKRKGIRTKKIWKRAAGHQFSPAANSARSPILFSPELVHHQLLTARARASEAPPSS
jgi:hypothetical protein